MIRKRDFIIATRVCVAAWIFLYLLYVLYLTSSTEFIDYVFPAIDKGKIIEAYMIGLSFVVETTTSKVWSGVMLLLLCVRVLAPLNPLLIRDAETVYAVVRNNELRCWINPDGFRWFPMDETKKIVNFNRTFFSTPREAKKTMDNKSCKVKAVSFEDLSTMGFIDQLKIAD